MPCVSAGVILNGTRIILSADDRNASTVVTNLTKDTYAVQSWVNDEKDDNVEHSPFIAMPALFKLKAGEEQVVRIIKTPGKLRNDRESVFYFNAQEIPIASGNDGNTLKVAIRTRIKVFYRPTDLMGTAIDAPGLLSWELVGNGASQVLRINNPTPYHVTFIGIRIIDGDAPIELEHVDMVAPKSTLDFTVGALKTSSVDVEYSFINDYGGYSDVVRVSAVHRR